MKKWLLAGIALCACTFADAQGFKITTDDSKHEVKVLYNNQLLTAFCFYDSIRKPILFPINTIDGITITRGFPIDPRPGERTDHPHHTGLWMNYESVNGLDFWNNSTAIPVEKRNHYGTIVHKDVVAANARKNQAMIKTREEWIRPDSVVLLNEETTYLFSIKANDLIIDRITTLKAKDTAVVFKDVKDGFLGIRVARELEMPSKEASKFLDDKGNETEVPASTKGVTGRYVNSDGVQGDSVWGTSSRWCMLRGRKDGKNVAIGIIDHPANPGYPTYWHARGYGLFAANPLGRKVFSNGKEELNLTLKPDEQARFAYRIVIHSGAELSSSTMNRLADDFGRQ